MEEPLNKLKTSLDNTIYKDIHFNKNMQDRTIRKLLRPNKKANLTPVFVSVIAISLASILFLSFNSTLLYRNFQSNQEINETKDLVANEIDVYKEIDGALTEIISSPSPSSNPNDYVTAHQEPFNFIVGQGDKAFNYFLKEFSHSNSNGLKEAIMALACVEILGKENPVNDWSSGRDWYEKYKYTLLDHTDIGGEIPSMGIGDTAKIRGDLTVQLEKVRFVPNTEPSISNKPGYFIGFTLLLENRSHKEINIDTYSMELKCDENGVPKKPILKQGNGTFDGKLATGQIINVEIVFDAEKADSYEFTIISELRGRQPSWFVHSSEFE